MTVSAERKKFYLFYFFLLVLIIIDRWNLLEQFTFRYVDDDQSIMWYAAKEFAAGNFHEPCFYGQPYGTMFESLCAVPLIWCGVSYPVALTVMMSAVTIFPYVLFSWLLLRREHYLQSLLVLSVLLLLPVEFGMITAVSRGVLTGLFFAAFALLVVYRTFRAQFIVFGFFAVLGLFANPSCLILLFPVGVWLLAENFRNKTFYIHALIGALPAALIWFGATWFYKAHPEYVVHGSYTMNFSLKILKPHEWDKFFGYVTPLLFPISGLLVFPMLIALGIVLIRQQKKQAGYALLAGIVLLFFSLTSFKVHYGFPTVFLSWARMFTAVPLLIAVFLSQVKSGERIQRSALVLLLVCSGFFVFRFTQADDAVRREVAEKTEHGMYVADIDGLKKLCDSINIIAQQHDVGLIVVGDRPAKHLINYGCPCLTGHFPATLEPQLDRRTWLLDREAPRVSENILFTDFYAGAVSQAVLSDPDAEIVSQEPLRIVLRNNTLRTDSVLSAAGLPLRAH
jgi:hypothetical protein